MLHRRTYSTWLAGLLLALYAFIATPVQVWHQHTYVINSDRPDTNGNNDLVKSGGKAVDSNCPVCSHHYSAHAKATHTYIAVPAIEYDVIQSYYLHSFPVEPYLYSSGRGPPTA